MSAGGVRTGPVDFERVNRAALRNSLAVVSVLLPDGAKSGQEWTARNPMRPDHRPGSFRINLVTGRWSDFATGDKGGDLVALAAYVGSLSQREAAIRLADSLGVDPFEGTRNA